MGNGGNGAGTDAFAESHGKRKPAFGETCSFCFNEVRHDPIVQASFALSMSAFPIPKNFVNKSGLTIDRPGIGGPNVSRFTSAYSIADQYLSKKFPKIGSMLESSSFRQWSGVGTKNILRGVGRGMQVVAPVFTASYSSARMFRCVTEKWNQPGE
ncbi:MAG: hypothetical protein KKE11_02675 [Gammaproteobacteria bacterium]|nr:hypothetical protein [Gammaproteobacteria bacterium]